MNKFNEGPDNIEPRPQATELPGVLKSVASGNSRRGEKNH